MNRATLTIVLDVGLTILLALVLLGGWQAGSGSSIVEGFSQGFQLLFFFMNLGLIVWLVLLIVAVARKRPAGIRATLLFALTGAAFNLLVLAIVGLIQQGVAVLVVLFAVEAGIAFLIAAVVAVLIVHKGILRDAPAA